MNTSVLPSEQSSLQENFLPDEFLQDNNQVQEELQSFPFAEGEEGLKILDEDEKQFQQEMSKEDKNGVGEEEEAEMKGAEEEIKSLSPSVYFENSKMGTLSGSGPNRPSFSFESSPSLLFSSPAETPLSIQSKIEQSSRNIEPELLFPPPTPNLPLLPVVVPLPQEIPPDEWDEQELGYTPMKTELDNTSFQRLQTKWTNRVILPSPLSVQKDTFEQHPPPPLPSFSPSSPTSSRSSLPLFQLIPKDVIDFGFVPYSIQRKKSFEIVNNSSQFLLVAIEIASTTLNHRMSWTLLLEDSNTEVGIQTQVGIESHSTQRLWLQFHSVGYEHSISIIEYRAQLLIIPLNLPYSPEEPSISCLNIVAAVGFSRLQIPRDWQTIEFVDRDPISHTFFPSITLTIPLRNTGSIPLILSVSTNLQTFVVQTPLELTLYSNQIQHVPIVLLHKVSTSNAQSTILSDTPALLFTDTDTNMEYRVQLHCSSQLPTQQEPQEKEEGGEGNVNNTKHISLQSLNNQSGSTNALKPTVVPKKVTIETVSGAEVLLVNPSRLEVIFQCVSSSPQIEIQPTHGTISRFSQCRLSIVLTSSLDSSTTNSPIQVCIVFKDINNCVIVEEVVSVSIMLLNNSQKELANSAPNCCFTLERIRIIFPLIPTGTTATTQLNIFNSSNNLEEWSIKAITPVYYQPLEPTPFNKLNQITSFITKPIVGTLSGNEKCTIRAIFEPLTPGIYSQCFAIIQNRTNSKTHFLMWGRAVYQTELSAAKKDGVYCKPNVVIFGEIPVNSVNCQRIKVCNATSKEQVVIVPRTSPPYFIKQRHISLQPQTYASFSCRFFPQQRGICNQMVTFFTKEGTSFQVLLVGEGI